MRLNYFILWRVVDVLKLLRIWLSVQHFELVVYIALRISQFAQTLPYY